MQIHRQNKYTCISNSEKKIGWKLEPNATPVKDNIHEFKLLSLKNKIILKIENATSCKQANNKVTITINDPPSGFTFEYAVDGNYSTQ
ncbi:MAG: hypothetical protein IPL42_09650 [Saprospiraceae bacterium]|nr:hypothetical protein [Saprospiraceae bacterium]